MASTSCFGKDYSTVHVKEVIMLSAERGRRACVWGRVANLDFSPRRSHPFAGNARLRAHAASARACKHVPCRPRTTTMTCHLKMTTMTTSKRQSNPFSATEREAKRYRRRIRRCLDHRSCHHLLHATSHLHHHGIGCDNSVPALHGPHAAKRLQKRQHL